MQKLEKITPERAELLKGWVHSGFAVNSQRRVAAEDRKGLESLVQYMERAPVSLDRLTYRLDGLVLYRGNFHPGLGTDHRLTSGVEFLALLVPHVLLRFESVIRSYGAASTTTRGRLGWIKKGKAETTTPSVEVIEGEESAIVREDLAVQERVRPAVASLEAAARAALQARTCSVPSDRLAAAPLRGT